MCACGYHVSLMDDPETNVFAPQTRVCPVCAGMERHRRIQEKRDGKPDEDHPEKPRPSDGRKTAFRLLSDGEVAEMRRNKEEGPHGDTS